MRPNLGKVDITREFADIPAKVQMRNGWKKGGWEAAIRCLLTKNPVTAQDFRSDGRKKRQILIQTGVFFFSPAHLISLYLHQRLPSEVKIEMAGRILFIGRDTCHRLPVLESAGYQIDCCTSVVELDGAIQDGDSPVAVLVTETDTVSPDETVSAARSRAPLPLVLFRETQSSYSEDGFDLVVPVLHSPAAWLAEIAALIERSQQLRAQSAALQRQSTLLRAEAAEVRAKSRAERRRSARERARNSEIAKPAPGSEPSGKKLKERS